MSSDSKQITIEADKRLYEREAILSAAYRISNKAKVDVQPSSEYIVTIKITSNNNNLDKLEKIYRTDLIDYQLRLDLEKQFGHVRDIIVEHAFKPIENLKNRLSENE